MAKYERLYDFANGTKTDADQVDAEFNALKSAVNATDDEIKSLYSTEDGNSGGDKVKVTPLAGITGDTVQAVLEGLQGSINQTALGQIPNGSLGKEKMSFSVEDTAGAQAKADAAAAASIPLIQKGAASGVATLNSSSELNHGANSFLLDVKYGSVSFSYNVPYASRSAWYNVTVPYKRFYYFVHANGIIKFDRLNPSKVEWNAGPYGQGKVITQPSTGASGTNMIMLKQLDTYDYIYIQSIEVVNDTTLRFHVYNNASNIANDAAANDTATLSYKAW